MHRYLPRASLPRTDLGEALECTLLTSHLGTPTSASSASVTTAPDVCPRCGAGLGRAIRHHMEQEPVTFTKYTRLTGQAAGEGGTSRRWCEWAHRDPSSRAPVPRTNQHIRLTTMYTVLPDLATTYYTARPERALNPNSVIPEFKLSAEPWEV